MVVEFKEDYQTRLNLSKQALPKSLLRHEQDELSSAFQDIVRWCIKGEINKLKKAINNKPDSIHEDIIFSSLKDEKSGYNIREIVASVGKTEVMKLIHKEQTTPHLYLGNALVIAIGNRDLKMVQCILSRKSSKLRCTQYNLFQAYSHQRPDIFKVIVDYMKDTEDKPRSPNDKFFCFDGLLCRAIEEDRFDFVKLIIENGGNPNEPRSMEERLTPLCVAMLKGKYATVEYLINNGADELFCDKTVTSVEGLNQRLKRLTQQKYKCMGDLIEMIDSLISKVEGMERKELDYNQKLVDVVEKNRLKLVKLLICQPAPYKYEFEASFHASFPLHCSIQARNFETTEFLLKSGASVLSRDKKSKLPIDHLRKINLDSLSEMDKRRVKELLTTIMTKMATENCLNPESEGSSMPPSKLSKTMVDQGTSTDEVANDDQQMPSSTQSTVKAFFDKSTSTKDIAVIESDNQQSKSSDEISLIVQPLKDLFLRNNSTF